VSSAALTRADWRTPAIILACGGLVLTLGMGVRHGFGLFLQPMSADLHLGRESFALAMAVQNLVWGAMQPFSGMIADRFGTAKVVLAGTVLYVLGLVTMAHATTTLGLVLTCGVLIGTGLSGVTFSVISGVLGRAYPPERRSMVIGISAAAGSFGQFAMVPGTQWLLSHLGWYGALLGLGGIALLMAPLAVALVEKRAAAIHTFRQSAGEAMREALAHRGYMLLTVGFFVCGFQVVFIGVHLPAYLADKGMPGHVAVTALALIGLFNIVGTYFTGWLGSRVPRKYILSAIYFARAVVIAVFIWLPLSAASVYAFAVALGPPVAFDRAADQQPRRADLRRALPRDAVRDSPFSATRSAASSARGSAGACTITPAATTSSGGFSIALGIAAGLINLPIDEREIKRPVAAAA
jgi:MFS family permease